MNKNICDFKSWNKLNERVTYHKDGENIIEDNINPNKAETEYKAIMFSFYHTLDMYILKDPIGAVESKVRGMLEEAKSLGNLSQAEKSCDIVYIDDITKFRIKKNGHDIEIIGGELVKRLKIEQIEKNSDNWTDEHWDSYEMTQGL